MTLRILLVCLLAASSPVAVQAQGPDEPPMVAAGPKPLSIQQATAMKCSAAFALVAAAQARGAGSEWPAMMPRGREFMVRSSARLMDDSGRTRDQVAAEIAAQARALGEAGALAAAMPPCLLLLDASGV